MATMSEQQWDASLDALLAPLKPENWERDPPVLVCCDRCWPPVGLAEAWFDHAKPRAWRLDLVQRLGTRYVRDVERYVRDVERHSMGLLPTGRRRPSREGRDDLPTGADGERPRGVTLRCRRCKRTRNHSLRRIYELADAAYLAGEDRIYP